MNYFQNFFMGSPVRKPNGTISHIPVLKHTEYFKFGKNLAIIQKFYLYRAYLLDLQYNAKKWIFLSPLLIFKFELRNTKLQKLFVERAENIVGSASVCPAHYGCLMRSIDVNWCVWSPTTRQSIWPTICNSTFMVWCLSMLMILMEYPSHAMPCHLWSFSSIHGLTTSPIYMPPFDVYALTLLILM